MTPSPYTHSQTNYQPSPNPPAYPSTQPFSQPAGSASFQPLPGYNGPTNLAHPTPYTTQTAPAYPPPQVPNPQHSAPANNGVIMDSMYWTAEAHSSYAPPSGYGQGHGQHGHAGRGHRGSHPHGNHGSKPRHPNKRDHGSAFNKPTSTAPKVPAAPSVPSFGNPLPCKPPPAADASRKPKKRKRKHNQLGLTPKTEEHESSEEEEDVDEEVKLAAGTDNGPLQFTYRGRTAVLQSASDIASWIEERRKKFPTQARIDEKKSAAEEAKAAREAVRREKEKEKNDEKEKQKAFTEPGPKLSDSQAHGDPALDAAIKAQRKADKIRRTLDREQKRFAKAEAEAEAARLKVQALQKQVLGLKDDEPNGDGDGDGVPTQPPAELSASLDRGDDLVMAGVTDVPRDPASFSVTNSGMGDITVASVAPNGLKDAMDTMSDGSESDWTSSSGSESESDSGSDGSAPEEVSSRREGPERVAPPPREGKKTVCRHFARNGQCNRGDKCKFSHEVTERGAKSKPPPPAIEKKGRKGLFQALIEQQKTEEDKRAMEVISWLGQHGMLEANSQANDAPQSAPS
ncbi:hypothetical protein N7478_002534 [Penicillium angulare]|uniref:uncharacterized protein n=1 Tax=Penicillium angulare TaxID=116970 RepID=UPI002541F2F5|nr:uncharacterized protein N7478_002534 [Penicillium angulare]KAJ5286848.1 hypothetical protein N7478_002534 [Penicillium angulare]